MSEKILVTGGTGFIGKHLCPELARRGVACVAPSSRERDLTRPEAASALFDEHADASVVIHLASFQAAGEFPARFPADQFQINHRIHLNVLAAWKQHLPRARFFGIGSSCAYPGTTTELVEERVLDGEVHPSVRAYGVTKRALLVGIRAYNDQYGLNGSYLIPPTLFGEWDDFHPDTAHVVGALVGRIVRACRDAAPTVEIWGDGTQVREFLYVKDWVDVLLDLAGRCDREVLNVGSGAGTSIRELAETIAQAAEYPGKLIFNPTKYSGIQKKVLDTTRLREKYGCRPPADLRPGIARTVRFYQEHFDRLQGLEKFKR
jgi:GDP-L-fucose synthase